MKQPIQESDKALLPPYLASIPPTGARAAGVADGVWFGSAPGPNGLLEPWAFNRALPAPGSVAAVVDDVAVIVFGGVSRFEDGRELARVGKWGAVQNGDEFGWYGQATSPEGKSVAAVWPIDGQTVDLFPAYVMAAGRLSDGRLVTGSPAGGRWRIFFDDVLVESTVTGGPLVRGGRCFARDGAAWVEVL